MLDFIFLPETFGALNRFGVDTEFLSIRDPLVERRCNVKASWIQEAASFSRLSISSQRRASGDGHKALLKESEKCSDGSVSSDEL